MSAPRVELLWWSGCPSHPAALQLVRTQLAELGGDPDAVRSRQIVTRAEAEAVHFVGSPTILVNGVDVDPAGVDEPAALTCRLYFTAAGRPSPLPDPERLRQALAAALNG